MASIFLSYDHEDYSRAAAIAVSLEQHGHSVWWDRQIHGGAEFNSEIEEAVARSDAVVVLWSATSVRSAWVRDEAAEGRDAGKLIPILVDSVRPPMGFRQYQTIDLAGWTGGKRLPRLPELLDAIDKVTKAAPTGIAERPPPAPAPRRSAATNAPKGVSRRLLIGGSAAAVIAAAAAGGEIWWSNQLRENPRVKALLDDGYDQMVKQTADEKTAGLFQQAVSIEPDNARAWGLLALLKAYLAADAKASDATRLVDESEKAARRALSLDSKQPDALLAMFELQGSTIDWITRDEKLRQIIAIDPNNVGAITELVLLTQATGLSRESFSWNERALAIEPLSPDYLGKRALKLWILGRTVEADKVADQVRSLYPNDPWVWFVRLHIYAFTGRIAAANAMLEHDPIGSARPQVAGLWRTAIAALAEPTVAAISRARTACIDGAQMSPLFSTEAVLIMSALRDVDTAFDIADEFLLSRGPLANLEKADAAEAVRRASWRLSTQWMFTPPAGIMRADQRFLPLCEAVGLTDYWRKRGVSPDYQRHFP